VNCPSCGGSGHFPIYGEDGSPYDEVRCAICGGSGIVPPSPVHPPPLEPDPDDAASYCEWYASQIGRAAELVKHMVPIHEEVIGIITKGTINGEEAVGIRHDGVLSGKELAYHLEMLAQLERRG
jgi:hypothetical protein